MPSIIDSQEEVLFRFRVLLKVGRRPESQQLYLHERSLRLIRRKHKKCFCCHSAVQMCVESCVCGYWVPKRQFVILRFYLFQITLHILLCEARTGTLQTKFQQAPLGSTRGTGRRKLEGWRRKRATRCPPTFPARPTEPWHQPLCFCLLSKRPEPATGGPSSESEPRSTETPLQVPVCWWSHPLPFLAGP